METEIHPEEARMLAAQSEIRGVVLARRTKLLHAILALTAAERRLVVAVEQEVPGSGLLRAFLVFHRANPHVYRLIERYALQLAMRGRQHFGMKAVFERVRWELAVETTSDDGLKLNNNTTAYYARLFALHHPEHAALFATRALGGRSDEAMEDHHGD